MQEIQRVTCKLNKVFFCWILQREVRKVFECTQVVGNRTLLLGHIEHALVFVVLIGQNFSHTSEEVEKVDVCEAAFV